MVRKIIAGRKHEESLEKYGFCAFLLSSKELRERIYPPIEIGEVVFLKGNAIQRKSIPVRLIAVQELQDESCISIYTVALEPEKYEPEET